MPEDHAAGSWLGDLTNEWKQAKPGERIIIVGAVVGVGALAWYFYTQNKGAASTTVNAPGQQGQGAPAGGGQQAGFPTIPSGQIPVLPAGINPIYDANGSVVGYGPGAQTPPSTSATTPTPADTGTGTPPSLTPSPSFGISPVPTSFGMGSVGNGPTTTMTTHKPKAKGNKVVKTYAQMRINPPKPPTPTRTPTGVPIGGGATGYGQAQTVPSQSIATLNARNQGLQYAGPR